MVINTRGLRGLNSATVKRKIMYLELVDGEMIWPELLRDAPFTQLVCAAVFVQCAVGGLWLAFSEPVKLRVLPRFFLFYAAKKPFSWMSSKGQCRLHH